MVRAVNDRDAADHEPYDANSRSPDVVDNIEWVGPCVVMTSLLKPVTLPTVSFGDLCHGR
jgi:hypothetical protein